MQRYVSRPLMRPLLHRVFLTCRAVRARTTNGRCGGGPSGYSRTGGIYAHSRRTVRGGTAPFICGCARCAASADLNDFVHFGGNKCAFQNKIVSTLAVEATEATKEMTPVLVTSVVKFQVRIRCFEHWICTTCTVVADGVRQHDFSTSMGCRRQDGSSCPVCPKVCEAPASSSKCEKYIPFTVQLRWLKSAQFAGFYAAEELGYWDDECLDVTIYQAPWGQAAEAIWDHGENVAMPHYLYAQHPLRLQTKTVFQNLLNFRLCCMSYWQCNACAEAKAYKIFSKSPSSTPADTTDDDWPSFLKYAVMDDRDIMHVSQHFRRGGIAILTSPIFEPEKTLSAKSVADVNNVKLGVPFWPDPDAFMLSTILAEHMTSCNYMTYESGDMVTCEPGDDVEFQPIGFGIEEILDRSENYDPVHMQLGMTYDQLGQLLATPVKGQLLKENSDFKVFSPADSGVFTLEDGITVQKSWLNDPVNEATLVKFLKGLHKGWIYCRDNEHTCAELVSPQGEIAHQLYQMREINKLVWPAPNGIGVHVKEGLKSTQETGLKVGIINRTVCAQANNDRSLRPIYVQGCLGPPTLAFFLTNIHWPTVILLAVSICSVKLRSWHMYSNMQLDHLLVFHYQIVAAINNDVPFEEHTTDKYAIEANRQLREEGLDVEGMYYSQSQFQVNIMLKSTALSLSIGLWGKTWPPLLLKLNIIGGLQSRLSFCMDENGDVDICEARTGAEVGATEHPDRNRCICHPHRDCTSLSIDLTCVGKHAGGSAAGGDRKDQHHHDGSPPWLCLAGDTCGRHVPLPQVQKSRLNPSDAYNDVLL
eukprot:scaffold46710_cov34-Prasinocladus_malaysianus.AAC.2